MPIETLFLLSYSTQSSSDKSTSSYCEPFSAAFTIQPDLGENSTGSTPRQSNATIVLNLPASSAVYVAAEIEKNTEFLFRSFET